MVGGLAARLPLRDPGINIDDQPWRQPSMTNDKIFLNVDDYE